jgi:hypothetical protein
MVTCTTPPFRAAVRLNSGVRPHMRFFWLLTAILTTCGCGVGSKSTQYEIDGQIGLFCVPNELTIQAPWWVPEDKPGAPTGFAFAGCWSDRDRSANCPFPRNIMSGTAHDLTYKYPRTYAAIPSDAFLRTVLSEHDTTFSIDRTGHYVSAQNKRLWQDWYIWKVSTRVDGTTRPIFKDGDELLAVCRYSNSVQAPLAGTPENVFCDRSLVSSGLSLHYSFESHDPFPTDFSRLDSSLVSVIESWRCAV